MIDHIGQELAASVEAAVEVERAAASAPDYFTMTDIRRIIASSTADMVDGLGFAGQLQVISMIGKAAMAEPYMQSTKFTFGDHAREVLRSELEQRLLPLRYELTFAHYAGRIVQILREAGALAAELAETPARICVRPESVLRYREDLERIFVEEVVPPADYMAGLLDTGCGFFSPLDKCLERPSWGVPEGITEESVGFSAAEIAARLRTMCDLQHLHLRREVDFCMAFAEELSAMSAPSVRL